MDIDVAKLMLKLAETQKGYVMKDLGDYSEAMVVVFASAGNFYLEFSRFQGQSTKEEAYVS